MHSGIHIKMHLKSTIFVNRSSFDTKGTEINIEVMCIHSFFDSNP